jgi:hypothetical protein
VNLADELAPDVAEAQCGVEEVGAAGKIDNAHALDEPKSPGRG